MENTRNITVLPAPPESRLLAPERRPSWAKRALDVSLAGAGLLGSAPLWLAIALAIKWEDGGPLFFHDRRVGRGGGGVNIFKLRALVVHGGKLFGSRPGDRDGAAWI